MPVFFDTHSHIDFLLTETKEPLSLFQAKCAAAKVAKVLLMGVYRLQFAELITLANKVPDLFYFGLGLHPLYVQKHSLEDLDVLHQLIEAHPKKCIAIGEIGLDRYLPELVTPVQWQWQCRYFEAQLHLAEQLKLPVCIHARRCHNDVSSFVKKYAISGIIHGFSGSYQEAKRYVDLGFKIGVGGVITYPRATKTRETISHLPPESLVLETDAPDMPIYQQKKPYNHPENIPFIFNTLQDLFKIDTEKLAQQLWRNSRQIFNLIQTS